MLEVLSGVATVAYVVIGGVIGVRLMRLAGRSATESTAPRDLPEWKLGLFFLSYACVGSAFNVLAYAGWSDPALALPDLLLRLCHGAFFWFAAIGITALLAFTRQTFRPAGLLALSVAIALSALMWVTAVLAGVTEGYAVRVLNGPAYWLQFAVRDLSFIWLATESLRYWAALRRRQRLGLADPLVVNRFLLIGAWGLALALLSFADPVARLVYFLETGSTTEWIPEIGRPMLLIGMTSAAGFLSFSVGALFLAFFPTAGYRRWLESAPRSG